jgi:hypothetical protein
VPFSTPKSHQSASLLMCTNSPLVLGSYCGMNRITAWVAALVFVLACPAFGETLEGHVIHVANGDTITVLNGKEQLRVRIAGIDAPERRQAFSKQPHDNLSWQSAGRSSPWTGIRKTAMAAWSVRCSFRV